MIKISQGDRAALSFSLTNGTGDAFDLTGATFETKVIGSDGAVDTFDNSHHAILSETAGTVRLTLSTAETEALKPGTRAVVMKVTQSSNPIKFHGQIMVLAGDPAY